MRAAAFAVAGPPEVLRVSEFDDPVAGPGQVRVRVEVAGVQPFDAGIRSGWTPPYLRLSFPVIPGNEFAGVVDQVGEGVSGVSAGDEVLGFSTLGCYAEYVVVPADQVTPKPENMPWEVAGGFSSGAQTASLAVEQIGVGPGDTFLVHGAAGAVGTVAVQLGVLAGATVIGTASATNHPYLRELGAVPILYGDDLAERIRAIAPQGVDAVLDGGGRGAMEASMALVKDRDRIVAIIEHDNALAMGARTVEGVRSAARLAELAALYADGRLRIHIRKAYRLDEAAESHRDKETGHGRGKIVLTVR